jgi:hypothetical protein
MFSTFSRRSTLDRRIEADVIGTWRPQGEAEHTEAGGASALDPGALVVAPERRRHRGRLAHRRDEGGRVSRVCDELRLATSRSTWGAGGRASVMRPGPDEWLGVFHEHVRRLDERRVVRNEEEARRRAEEEARRRQREAEERPPRSARGAWRRTARPRTTSAGPRSIVDRIANGSPKDWADLLGVKPICSCEELRRAHRNAVLRHHPDRCGDEEMMKAVNLAQRRLGDMLEMYWAAGIA